MATATLWKKLNRPSKSINRQFHQSLQKSTGVLKKDKTGSGSCNFVEETKASKQEYTSTDLEAEGRQGK